MTEEEILLELRHEGTRLFGSQRASELDREFRSLAEDLWRLDSCLLEPENEP